VAVIAVDDVTLPGDITELKTQIQHARSEANVVIVSIHWGNEYQTGPDERQQELAVQLAEVGADVIWGHHPHVLQKMEWIKTSSGRKTLVMYSLGNLLFDQWMLEDAHRTAVIKISFKDSEIESIEAIPLIMDRISKQLQIPTGATVELQILDRLRVEKLKLDNVYIER
jgi:poly-gamma-glutamate capsule biosynthesis protein CapA/YwtB (metallophosphatase superfamily)